MKKNILFVALSFSLFVRAMEQENQWSITVYGAHITLHKQDILEYYADENKKIDIVICVGQHKQEELGETPIWGNMTGECWQQKTVRFTPKKDSINCQKAWNGCSFPQREGIQFLVVTEPRVFNCAGEDSKYWCDDSECYTKEHAIEESCKGLLLCYNAVLNKGIELLQGKNIKNIALPMLGADSQYEHARMFKEDVAQIAVQSVIEYLKNNRCAYNNVEFFVEEYADFKLYQDLLIQLKNREQNVLLLYIANKDSENTFAMLPGELINYITRLV